MTRKRELLFSVTKKDFDITYFSGTGAGGQHRNKHQNCIRILHRDSGAMVTGQSQRSRIANQKEALNNLIKHPKYRIWWNRKVSEVISGKKVEEIVDEEMSPDNLLIEKKTKEGWEQWTDTMLQNTSI